MADLIERTEELILAVNAGARAIENTKRYHGVTYCLDVFSDKPKEIPYLKAAQILREFDELTPVDAVKWISVEDRLPDSMDDVLVWYEYRAYNGSGGLSKRKVKEYGIGCYIPQMGVWSKDPGIGTEARVIAWMPLPEPPDMRGNT